jgi:hypothetical protein
VAWSSAARRNPGTLASPRFCDAPLACSARPSVRRSHEPRVLSPLKREPAPPMNRALLGCCAGPPTPENSPSAPTVQMPTNTSEICHAPGNGCREGTKGHCPPSKDGSGGSASRARERARVHAKGWGSPPAAQRLNRIQPPPSSPMAAPRSPNCNLGRRNSGPQPQLWGTAASRSSGRAGSRGAPPLRSWSGRRRRGAPRGRRRERAAQARKGLPALAASKLAPTCGCRGGDACACVSSCVCV